MNESDLLCIVNIGKHRQFIEESTFGSGEWLRNRVDLFWSKLAHQSQRDVTGVKGVKRDYTRP
jgi:hypothetical protein